jgi:hypothetical protein
MRTPLMDFSDLVAECRMYIRDGRKWGGMENSITDRDVDGIIAADAYLVALRARCEDVDGMAQILAWQICCSHKDSASMTPEAYWNLIKSEDIREVWREQARAVSKFLVEGKG